MKRATLYARVSGDRQKEEGTIASQIFALKKHIVDRGDVLVHEYIDDGYSGAFLDRPALEQLRKDIRTDSFDTIYFFCADRIAREGTHQKIIIAEILKCRKRVIINGQDYVENPENKFSLDVLGAVAEFERAKIAERSMRGRQHRLKQGFLLSHGHTLYGYNYIKRTAETPIAYQINEEEAAVVRYIFETYAKGDVGMCQITRHLEEIKTPTKFGKTLWNVPHLRNMLKNVSYTGIKYFNTERVTREYADPIQGLQGLTPSRRKTVKRPREEWIGIKIPPIVSQELFDAVQRRIEQNRAAYRNPQNRQLLSTLIWCGKCGWKYFSYRRYYKHPSGNGMRVYHKIAYKCISRHQPRKHADGMIKRCTNPEVSAPLLHACVWSMIRNNLLHPDQLRPYIEFLREKAETTQLRLEKELKQIELRIKKLGEEKKRVLDLYAVGDLDREQYGTKCLWYDNEINKVRIERMELVKQLPVLHNTEVITESIMHYCDEVRLRFEKCGDDPLLKRQFFVDYIPKVVYTDGTVELYGTVPVRLKGYDYSGDEHSEATKIAFCIKGVIDRTDLRAAGSPELRYRHTVVSDHPIAAPGRSPSAVQ